MILDVIAVTALCGVYCDTTRCDTIWLCVMYA